MAMLILEEAVRRHYVYKTVWDPVIGEELPAEREEGNTHDRHAVCLKREGKVVGHMYLRSGGSTVFEVTG